MASYKLGVQVINAYDLVPKEKGSSNPCVELEFNGQKFCTAIKEKELNPVWNERFYFNISDPSSIPNLSLEASIYSINTEGNSRSFLGKVRLAGTSFVPSSDAALMHYPLENNFFFSRVRGELGLKVFLTDDPSIKASNPLPPFDPATKIHPQKQVLNPNPNQARERSGGSRHTFRSIGKEAHNQHEHCPPVAAASEQAAKCDAGQFKCELPPRFANVCSRAPSKKEAEYALKKTNPSLGFGRIVGGQVIHAGKSSAMYDLVEPMQYLFVRVVKAKDLPESTNPFTELKFGNSAAATKQLEKKPNPEWNEVFAFSCECMHATILEVQVKDKKQGKDEYIGRVRFDISDVPMQAPPDSSLAPEWYHLDDKKNEKIKGEVMLAVWIGTQADEAFPDAWQSDVANAAADASVAASPHVRSKVYHAPRLWYVRVNIVEVLDIEIADKNRTPEVFVKAQIGDQYFRTRKMKSRKPKYFWNEEIMFVAAEPFEDQLVLSVEDRVKPDKDEVIGRVTIPLFKVEKRVDDRTFHSRWFNLEKPNGADGDEAKKDKPASRIHLRVFLDGGYHVLDESTQYSSDLRPSAKQLWKPAVGVLQLGILGATGLLPMKTKDGKGMTDAYCVAKYGKKWIRTRTMINSLCPRFNEQHTWEVYDPATVLTIGVFNNCQIGEKGNGEKDAKDSKGEKEGKDAIIGKIRIRLSTLETGRVYTHSYPLLILQPSGLKKMGELHLAIRFSSTSFVSMMSMYARPLLPKMHYIRPLMLFQIDVLRHHAIQILAARLGRMEPPLRKEVVEFMSDVDCHLWSMRRSKANFFRLMSVFSRLFEVGKWFGAICSWTKPVASVLVHILFVMLVCFPELILPTAFSYVSFIGLWNYRYRPQYPPHMNTNLSQAENADPDELDEEFDTFQTSKEAEVVKKRYDRLRCVAGKVQTLVGNIATQGERIQALISWRDPRATSVFVLLCVAAAAIAYVTPLRVVVVLLGFYTMRHPQFRQKTPSAPANFFRRLPARTDSML